MSAPFRPLHDRGVMARWQQYLPVTEATPFVSLNEGSTPLIYSPKLSARVGRGCEVFIKYEGLNPTGSFKDRGMTVALSKAVESGAQAVICASTGNTSAAAAAYAARASIACIVLLPAGKIAFGKLAQAFMYGAKVVAIDGNFDDALRLVREIGETEPIAIVNSINPHRLQGQKTAAFEIIETLGDAPDIHVLPVGNAGNISAYWMGYDDFHKLGKATWRSSACYSCYAACNTLCAICRVHVQEHNSFPEFFLKPIHDGHHLCSGWSVVSIEKYKSRLVLCERQGYIWGCI